MRVDRNLLLGRPCIYKITNGVDGKFYVGKTKCLVRRSYHYNSAFRSSRSDQINDYMLSAMIKYGYENFFITPLEFCEIAKLAERELFWITTLNSNNRNIGYNLRVDSSTGMIAAPETRAKIARNISAQWASGVRDSHGVKLSLTLARNPELRAQIGKNFSKALTQYRYIVLFPDWTTEICNYKRLQELKLDKALCGFWKKKVDSMSFKRHWIRRERV